MQLIYGIDNYYRFIMSCSKQKCKYWDKCFRQNAEHLDKFLHPQPHKSVAPKSSVPGSPQPRVVKKPAVPKIITNVSETVKRLPSEEGLLHYFVTKIKVM